MRSISIVKRRKFSKPFVFSCLLLALLVSAILRAPRSSAIRQNSSASSSATQIPSEKRRRPEFVPGTALVRFKRNRGFEGRAIVTAPAESADTGREQIPVELDRFEGSDLVDGLRIARVPPDETLQAIAALRARDDVLYAEPNYVEHLDVIPNDTFVNQLYGMFKLGMPAAWDIERGSRNIVVGVVDTGIDLTHPDLQANIWTNPMPGSIPGISGDLHGYDFRDNTGVIIAEDHATHVAGTIGAEGNNAQGVVGVNWQVSLMSLRFIDESINFGTDSDALRAFSYAKQMRDLWISSSGTRGANIRVLNASFGGGGYSQAFADSLNALGQSGILFVAAAGNNGRDTDLNPHYPSDYALPNVISVGATTQSDALAGFSNFGLQTVMLGAPGSGILSTTPANTYSTFSGTSMATPHVTGGAALLWARNPNLTVNQLRALLSFNGDVIAALQSKTLTGRRLNVFNSLQAMTENDTTPPGMVGGFQVIPTGRRLNLSWAASGDDGAAGQASLYEISFLDQGTNAVVPLANIGPAVSGAFQNVDVKLPYRHLAGIVRLQEFDNVGNEGTPVTAPISIHPNFADPYTTTLNSPAPLSTGGTPLGLTFDDRYRENFSLPFRFSFFGQIYNTVTISTNGNLYFSTPPKRPNGDANDVPSAVGDLSQFKMIAGMWDDLDLSTSRRADADVYVVQPDSSRIIFRWQGVAFETGVPINFEIELRNDASIITRYGSGNVNLFPVVGISDGEPEPYSIDALTSETSPRSLTNAQSAVFSPRATIQMSSLTYSVSEGTPQGTVDIVLNRSGDITSSASVSLATSDTSGANNCATVTGLASSRCDYITTIATVKFAAGESTKSVPISIIDDSYVEGDETFSVSLDNGFGASLGAQSRATVTISDNGDVNGPNPLDQTGPFVRQHYLDFLNREPDPSGFSFWTGEIDNCTPKPQCTEIKRINVSAAFFLSIEFQQTGYLVERLYKAAYGNGNGISTLGGTAHILPVPIVRLTEFLPDTQQIGQGVVVNQPGWEQVLEANKQAFISDFVRRSRFVTAFPPSTSPAQFVGTLNTNAGNPLSTSERDQLVSDLISGAKTRAEIVRAVAEDPDLVQAETNRAFVLMQYFGYLRRNPNDAPDADHTGYEFWLNKLNQFNGNFVNAEMVKAFLVSNEYRRRLGPP